MFGVGRAVQLVLSFLSNLRKCALPAVFTFSVISDRIGFAVSFCLIWSLFHFPPFLPYFGLIKYFLYFLMIFLVMISFVEFCHYLCVVTLVVELGSIISLAGCRGT